MKRLAFLLVVVAVGAGCSDRYLIHKASSAYWHRLRVFEAKCVDIPEPKGPAECPAEEADLRADYVKIDAATDAALRGPLPKAARTDLKAIARK